jgi:hypothetical protein
VQCTFCAELISEYLAEVSIITNIRKETFLGNADAYCEAVDDGLETEVDLVMDHCEKMAPVQQWLVKVKQKVG